MTTGNFKIAGDAGSSEESSPVAGFMSKYIISLELFLSFYLTLVLKVKKISKISLAYVYG